MIKKILSSNLVKSSALLPIGTALNFILTLVVARQLSTGDFGYYSSVIYLANILAVVFSLGLPISAQMRIPTYKLAGNVGRIEIFFRASIAVLAVAIAIGFVTAAIGFQQSSHYLVVLPVCVCACMIWVFQRYIALGFDKVAQALIPREIVFHLVMIVLISVGVADGATSALVMYAVVLCMVTLPFLIKQLQVYPLSTGINYKQGDVRSYRALIIDSVPFAIVRMGQLGTTGAEIVVMSYFLPMEMVGIYAFIFKFTLVGGLVNRIVNVANGQRFSHLYSSGRLDKFRNLYFKSMMLSVAVSSVLLIVVLFFGKYILGLVKEEFLSGYPVLVVLIVAQVIGSSLGPTTIALNMIGQQKTVAVITCVVAVTTIFACVFTAPRFGMVGVAVVVSVSLVVSKISQLIVLNRKLGKAFNA